jgi:hypothetical protein
MRTKNSYHTSIKTCYALGFEELLPKSLRKRIPRSTYHGWKAENEAKYVGHEFANRIAKNLDHAHIILNDKVKHERALFVAFCRIKITIIQLIGKPEFKKILQQNKSAVVSLIEKVKPIFGGTTMLKYFNLNSKTYSAWKASSLNFCKGSHLKVCFRKITRQITTKEVKVIKALMTNPDFSHWPAASLWAMAIRTEQAVMSRATWYKYTKMLQLERYKISRRFKPKKVPLRAERVNEIWHADVSIYITVDNVRFYIYTLVDNFSRMILAWDISTKLSARIRLKSIECAVKEQFNLNLRGQSIDLIVDGGSENNNGVIQNFIRDNQVKINKKIAMKDIVQSNSLIEATYKIMKYRYFHLKQIVADAMFEEMKCFVHDYNIVRPHYSHSYKTPHEVHYGIEPIDYKKIINKALKDRVAFNRKQSCIFSC